MVTFTQVSVCLPGGVHGCGRVCAWLSGVCMIVGASVVVGECVWLQGVCMAAGGACVGYDEIRSMSGWYASYWNAFFFSLIFFAFASTSVYGGGAVCPLHVGIHLPGRRHPTVADNPSKADTPGVVHAGRYGQHMGSAYPLEYILVTGRNKVGPRSCFYRCVSVHRGGVSASVHAGMPDPPRPGTPPPPDQAHPPRPGTPPPWSRHPSQTSPPPPGPGTPSQEQTPPRPRADTPCPGIRCPHTVNERPVRILWNTFLFSSCFWEILTK